jgi:hypothetical protein
MPRRLICSSYAARGLQRAGGPETRAQMRRAAGGRVDAKMHLGEEAGQGEGRRQGHFHLLDVKVPARRPANGRAGGDQPYWFVVRFDLYTSMTITFALLDWHLDPSTH